MVLLGVIRSRFLARVWPVDSFFEPPIWRLRGGGHGHLPFGSGGHGVDLDGELL